jgi:probable rRNA maturation factor
MPLSPSKSKVCFFFQEAKITLNDREALKRFILSIFKKEGKKHGSINYIFCADKILLKINQQFLKHDFYTDIITFDLSEGETIQAEIYISVDRVKQNARQLGLPLREELHRVIFHGILHLCGYGDKKEEERAKMRAREEFYLSQYFK